MMKGWARMGLFGKKCAMCSASGVPLWPAMVASGKSVKVCNKCKRLMGGKARAR